MQARDVNLDFIHYKARTSGPSSGQYVFVPDGPAQPLDSATNLVYVIDGPLRKQVLVAGDAQVQLFHQLWLDNNAPAVQIRNEFDIRLTRDYELGMRLTFADRNGNWQRGEQFYTDNNGFSVGLVFNLVSRK